MADEGGRFRAWLGPTLGAKLEEWLREDCPSVDWAGYLVGDYPTTAIIYAKSSGVLAGGPAATEVFKLLGCTVQWHLKEGAEIERTEGKVEIARVEGPANQLLLGERLALNILSRVSGIATLTRSIRVKMNERGFTRVKLADTRKTTPGNQYFTDL